MNIAAQFKEFLKADSSAPSPVTIKNYLSDVNRFLRWLEEDTDSTFDPALVNKNSIEKYKQQSLTDYSPSSVERSLSSLRKFFHFLKLEGYISSSPFESAKVQVADPWKLNEFKNHLYVFNSSYLTIKNYVMDVRQFAKWAEAVIPASQDLEEKPVNKLNAGLIEEYRKRLITDLGLSPVSVNRKLSSLRKYHSWAKSEGLVRNRSENKPKVEDLATQMTNENEFIAPKKSPVTSLLDYALVLPIATLIDKGSYLVWVLRGRPVFKQADPYQIPSVNPAFYSPSKIRKDNSLLGKALFNLRYSRPAWYLNLDSMGFVRYAKFAGIVLLVSLVSFSLYSKFNPSKRAVLSYSTSPSATNRTFEGRLTDSFGNPITSQTNLRLAIYNDKFASGAALLWQENVEIQPDQNGDFVVDLGKNNLLPRNIFTENTGLWLGITIENSLELKPRKQISTVDLSADSERLQGLLPIIATKKTRNVILALDSAGDLNIGQSANPNFRATEGTFTLAGKTLVLKTLPGSNGNVVLAPDGSGQVDIQKDIVNSAGVVSINDLLSILATDSGQAALTINQLSGGKLISASTSGVSVFEVDKDGQVVAKGTINGLGISEGKVISGIWQAETIAPSYGGTGFKSYDKGDLLYADGSNSLAKLKIGANGTCLISNGTIPTWGPCGIANITQNSATSAFIVNQEGSGDLLSASSGGKTAFAVKNDGSVVLGESISSSGGGATNDGSPASINGLGDSGSLIPNSSFEITNGNFADGWIVAASSSGLVEVDDSDSVHGSNSALVSLNNSEAAFYSPCVPISGLSNNYNLQWYLRDSGSDPTVRAYLDQYNSKSNCKANNSPSFSQAIEGVTTSGWGLQTGIPQIQSGAKWARVHFFLACETCSNSNTWIDGVRLIANSESAGLDYAENYSADPIMIPQPGELISLTRIDGKTYVKKSDTNSDPNLLGIVSTRPGQVLDDGSVESPKVPIALSGRVPTKVSTKNGVINVGDAITSSPTPGVGVKAKNNDSSVGVAMEPYQASDPGQIGTILVFVKNTTGNSQIFTGDKIEAKNGTFDQLQTKEATIDGILRAKEIISDNISLSESSLASLSAIFAQNFEKSPSTSLFELTVANRLFVGPTLSLADNSINVLGSNLELQPLKTGGVSFVGGQVKIDVDGNLVVGGNVVAQKDLQVLGKVLANILSPLPGQDFVVELTKNGDGKTPQFIIRNSSESGAILSVNDKGDIETKGKAKFNKISLDGSSEFTVVSNTEIVAKGAAGTAQIKDGESQLTVKNPDVSKDSLIYITPKIPDATIYIVKQNPQDGDSEINGSFTVGISQILDKDVPFNWLIIN